MKKVLCVLLTAFLLIGFSACDNAAKPDEPDSKPQSSSEQSSSDSEPEVKKELNQDLLSDIGLTYSQLVEKHGEVIEVSGANGGLCYRFKNGYGKYPWAFGSDIDENGGSLQSDKNGNYVVDIAPKPNPQARCNCIDYVQAKDLFPGESFPVKLSELESTYKIKNINYETELGMDDYYWASYSYNNLSIILATKKLGELNNDSFIAVSG